MMVLVAIAGDQTVVSGPRRSQILLPFGVRQVLCRRKKVPGPAVILLLSQRPDDHISRKSMACRYADLTPILLVIYLSVAGNDDRSLMASRLRKDASQRRVSFFRALYLECKFGSFTLHSFQFFSPLLIQYNFILSAIHIWRPF